MTNFKKLGRTESHTLLYESGYEYETNKNYSVALESLTYDKGFTADGEVDEDNWHKPGNAAAAAQEYGLPAMVRGNPLGCGCREAHLHGIGKVKDGKIECDYMCYAGWHNFMVFNVKQKKQKRQKKILLDKFGNVTADEGFTAGDLAEL